MNLRQPIKNQTKRQKWNLLNTIFLLRKDILIVSWLNELLILLKNAVIPRR